MRFGAALNIDGLQFGLAILNRFSSILLCCDSTQFGQKLKGSFIGVFFAKGCEFRLVSLGAEFGVEFRGVVFLWKIREKGKGKGRVGGWGGRPAKEPASQCARICQNYLLVNYPCDCDPDIQECPHPRAPKSPKSLNLRSSRASPSGVSKKRRKSPRTL